MEYESASWDEGERLQEEAGLAFVLELGRVVLAFGMCVGTSPETRLGVSLSERQLATFAWASDRVAEAAAAGLLAGLA